MNKKNLRIIIEESPLSDIGFANYLEIEEIEFVKIRIGEIKPTPSQLHKIEKLCKLYKSIKNTRTNTVDNNCIHLFFNCEGKVIVR